MLLESDSSQTPTPTQSPTKPKRDIERLYYLANEVWPKNPLPTLTAPEAVTAAKRLWRIGCGKKCPYRIKTTSGNRRTGFSGFSVVRINPERGWRSLVHSLSHLIHYEMNPSLRPHHTSHACLERRLAEYAVAQGWLDGKLKRADRTKPKVDIKLVRRLKLEKQKAKLVAKIKRCSGRLKAVEKRLAYYERSARADASTTTVSATIN